MLSQPASNTTTTTTTTSTWSKIEQSANSVLTKLILVVIWFASYDNASLSGNQKHWVALAIATAITVEAIFFHVTISKTPSSTLPTPPIS